MLRQIFGEAAVALYMLGHPVHKLYDTADLTAVWQPAHCMDAGIRRI